MADDKPSGVEQLLETPDLAGALESDRFKQFLDQVPVAIAVAELNPVERVVYANVEFERLTGQSNSAVLGRPWESLPSGATAVRDGRTLGHAVAEERDYLGPFTLPDGGGMRTVDA